jgi:hypothetical protein
MCGTERRDRPAALRLEAAGEQVGDVAGRLDRLLDAGDRLRRDDAGLLSARDAVIGETPAIRATSCSVAGLPRRVESGVEGMRFGPGRQRPTSSRGYSAVGE